MNPLLSRLWRGIACWMTFTVTPLGWFCYGRLVRRMEPERLDQGLVLILTGIEGRSFLNVGMLAGLVDGGVRSALEIVDWTTGNKLLFLWHLRGSRRNQVMAAQLAGRIVEYQDQYPGRPVWIVGHSGGGGMALLTARAMPAGRVVTGIIMLAAAVSPQIELQAALDHIETSLWNYYSWFDAFFLRFGTTLLGTIDGRHGSSAGAVGLQGPEADAAMDAGRLIQVRWNWRMVAQFNLGEHFGCTHRVFVEEEIAPRIVVSEDAARTARAESGQAPAIVAQPVALETQVVHTPTGD